jgi:release factor glutamine methyltransferase
MGFCQADVLEGIAGTFDLIVSNPPYIPSADIAVLDMEVRDHDPIQALDGGSDGLEFYRRIISGAGERLAPNGALLLEFGIGQSEAVSTLAREGGFLAPEIFKDLAGLDRAMLARTWLGVL